MLVKHLLDKPKRLIGIDGGIPQSPAPSPTPSAHKSGTDSSVRSCSPSSGQEFKKPGGLRGTSAASSSSSANHQRGGFVKPADGKPPYGGRGAYPGQPVKHGGSSNDHRNHGLLPAKGPPPPPTPVGNSGTLPIGNSGGSVGNLSNGGSLASRTQFAGRLKLIEVNVSNRCFASLFFARSLFACVDCRSGDSNRFGYAFACAMAVRSLESGR